MTYAVTVNNGSGSGDYAEGASVTVTADVPSGKEFVKWSGDGVTFEDETAITTTFVMPGNAVSVTANFKDKTVTKYAVTVNGGTADKTECAKDETVTVTAEIPSGKEFVKWSGDGVTFEDETAATTTFVMPGKAVSVTANFKDKPFTKYAVTVTVDGGGAIVEADKTECAEGDTVTVTVIALATDGTTFVKWTSDDGVVFADASALSTTFVMPGNAVSVTAQCENTIFPDYHVTVNEGAGSGTHKAGDSVTIVILLKRRRQ